MSEGDAQISRAEAQSRRENPRHRSWEALALVALSVAGACVAYGLTEPGGLTGPAGCGPFRLVRVAEAPAVEVAGARAVGEWPADIASRLPPGASIAGPATPFRLPAAGPRPVVTTPDGVTLRFASGALTAAERSGDSGVAGITEPPEVPVPAGTVAAATLTLVYRPLDVPAPAQPAPRIVRAFALSAAGPDGQPVPGLAAPLTVSVPHEPAGVVGWLALAIYEPDADAWAELPVRSVNARAATVSAQTYRPGVIALLENDSDPDGDPLGVFERETTSQVGGEVRCAQSGACVYTPPLGFTGVDVFTYGLGDRRTHASGAQTWSENVAEGSVTVRVGRP